MAIADPVIAVGIGCRRGCDADAIVALVREAQHRAGCAATLLAAASFKQAEPGVQEAARRLGVPLALIGRAALVAAQPRCPTRSAAALAATGLASVAEAAALAAAGAEARLVVPRIAGSGATCALAVCA